MHIINRNACLKVPENQMGMRLNNNADHQQECILKGSRESNGNETQ